MVILGLFLSSLIGVSLGMLGGGGSILTLPILLYLFNMETHQAIAGSLFVVGTTSLLASLKHARLGNVSYRTGLLFSIGGMSGAYLGGRLGVLMSGNLLIGLFIGMMVVTAGSMLRGSRTVNSSQKEGVRKPLILVLDGFLVGGFTGMIGAGGGFLVVPALLFIARLPIRTAIGTSLFVICLKSFAGFLGYLSETSIPWGILISVTVAALIGSLIGTRLSNRISPDRLRHTFAYFILVMAALVVYKQFSVTV